MSFSGNTFADVKQAIVLCASGEAEKAGHSALAGKIYALLLFAPEPLSLEQIADRLDVSKAAVSIRIRHMTLRGLCRKLPRRSDRRDYYTLPDPLGKSFAQNMTQLWTERQRSLRQTLHSLSAVPVSEEEETEYRAASARLSELSASLEMLLMCFSGLMREREEQEQTLRRHLYAAQMKASGGEERSSRADSRFENDRKLDLHAGLPAIVTED